MYPRTIDSDCECFVGWSVADNEKRGQRPKHTSHKPLPPNKSKSILMVELGGHIHLELRAGSVIAHEFVISRASRVGAGTVDACVLFD